MVEPTQLKTGNAMTEALFLAYEVVQGLIQLRKGKLEIESGNHDFTKDVPCREKRHTERHVVLMCLALFILIVAPGTLIVQGSTPSTGVLSQTL